MKEHYKNNFKYDPLAFCKDNVIDFIGGNLIKYIARYPYKEQREADLKKAIDYLDNFVNYAPRLTISRSSIEKFMQNKGLSDMQKDIFKDVFYFLNTLSVEHYNRIHRKLQNELKAIK
jgi:hypothetical protein